MKIVDLGVILGSFWGRFGVHFGVNLGKGGFGTRASRTRISRTHFSYASFVHFLSCAFLVRMWCLRTRNAYEKDRVIFSVAVQTAALGRRKKARVMLSVAVQTAALGRR